VCCLSRSSFPPIAPTLFGATCRKMQRNATVTAKGAPSELGSSSMALEKIRRRHQGVPSDHSKIRQNRRYRCKSKSDQAVTPETQDARMQSAQRRITVITVSVARHMVGLAYRPRAETYLGSNSTTGGSLMSVATESTAAKTARPGRRGTPWAGWEVMRRGGGRAVGRADARVILRTAPRQTNA